MPIEEERGEERKRESFINKSISISTECTGRDICPVCLLVELIYHIIYTQMMRVFLLAYLLLFARSLSSLLLLLSLSLSPNLFFASAAATDVTITCNTFIEYLRMFVQITAEYVKNCALMRSVIVIPIYLRQFPSVHPIFYPIFLTHSLLILWPIYNFR